jgi:hypothetical protein
VGPVAKSCVVFDMDGVLVDSEPLWVRARQDLVRAAGGRWLPQAETAMMGISSDRWSAYMHDRLGLKHLTPERIRGEVIERMIALYKGLCCISRGVGRAGWVDASPSRRRGSAAIQLRRISVPTGGDHAGGSLVPALRPVLPRRGGPPRRALLH